MEGQISIAISLDPKDDLVIGTIQYSQQRLPQCKSPTKQASIATRLNGTIDVP